MEQFDLKKFLVENKLTTNSKVLKEALNKPLKDFGPDLQKRLQALGFQAKLFTGKQSVPMDAVEKIMADPNLAGISYVSGNDGTYEYIEVVVNKEKLKDLQKVKQYFQIPDQAYGPDKELGWVIKNVQNVNPGDIISSKLETNNDTAQISYYRNTRGSSSDTVTRDK